MMQIRPDMERRQDQRWREGRAKDGERRSIQRSMNNDAENKGQRWRLVGPKAMQKSMTKGCADKQVIKNKYLRFGYK